MKKATAAPNTAASTPKGPLDGIRVLDMSRVLAGPSATQILGDMGADVIKVEKPGEGDDTRRWGPPFLRDRAGRDTAESAYYLSANRNKRSLTVDFTTTEGQAIIKQLAARADILIENYKTGGMEKYGLSYAQLREDCPRLIYCALTGFGQDGPYKNRGGYDYIVQAMGGIMGLTGPRDGDPYKIGVAQADLTTGLYAVGAILAALYHRTQSGKGQFIDIALFDTQIASLSNAGQYYLTAGTVTPRMGNAHPTIVPYETFMAADGHFVLAIGNDRQFQSFCTLTGRTDLSHDPRFITNAQRVVNRDALVPIVATIMRTRTRKAWEDLLTPAGIACGPVNNIAEVFADPHVAARHAVIEMNHPLSDAPQKLIANPVRFSDTPVTYRHAPPQLGADTDEILAQEIGLSAADIAHLRDKGVV